ncbi:MAG: carbohydrate ABC transporter permease [Brooklawnia sp.]|uniref:carbohydrate ABC transporter permease n=1 Tax=Brooklawnia sp. TaxID=2699740 RepID=UPI003C74AF01
MGYKLTRWTILAVYASLIIIPVMVVMLGSFKTMSELFEAPFALPGQWRVQNYVDVLTTYNMDQAFANSVIVTASSVFTTLLLGSMAAYGVSRLRGWKSALIFGFLVLGMAVPAQANMIPQFVLFDRLGLLNSLFGLVLINVVTGLPVSTFIMGGFMRTLPNEMFEAAAVDGVGPGRAYLNIAIPLSLPSIAATAIFLFVIQWNELLYPLLFIQSPDKQTIPLRLLNFQGEFLTNYPLLFTGVGIASIPITIAYVFLQRYFVEGLTSGAVKG